MNIKTIQNLQYFIGKVCSIFTPQINRSFDEMQSREHFVIRIQEINADGIWGVHPLSGLVTFFAMPHILSIVEEVELNSKNPEHAQMLQEFEQRTGKKAEGDIAIRKAPAPVQEEQVPFVDISYLEKLASQTKQQYDHMDKLSSKPLTQINLSN